MPQPLQQPQHPQQVPQQQQQQGILQGANVGYLVLNINLGQPQQGSGTGLAQVIADYLCGDPL